MPINIEEFQQIAAKAKPRPWEFVATDGSLLALGTKDDAEGQGHVLSARRCDSCQDNSTEENFMPCLWPSEENSDFILYAVNNIEDAVEEIVGLRKLLRDCTDSHVKRLENYRDDLLRVTKTKDENIAWLKERLAEAGYPT